MSAVPLGYAQGTSLAAAKSLATLAGGTIPAGATFAIVQSESVNLRYRDDGTAPTATVGMIIAAGDSVVVRLTQFGNFSVIQTTTGGIVNVSFYK